MGTQHSVDEDFADVHQLVFEDDEENLEEIEKEGDDEGDEDEDDEEMKPDNELSKRTSAGAADRVGKYSFAGVSSTDPPRPPFCIYMLALCLNCAMKLPIPLQYSCQSCKCVFGFCDSGCYDHGQKDVVQCEHKFPQEGKLRKTSLVCFHKCF